MTPFGRLARWLSLRIVALWARVVPSVERSRWRREWTAEIEARHRRRQYDGAVGREMDLVGRSIGAGIDAWYLRKGEWGLHSMMQEAKYAIRRLVRAPLFTLTAVVTLGLAIGANTAVFSVVRNVILAPLPYPDSDRLVLVLEQNQERGWDFFTVSPANFLDWRTRATSFQHLAAVSNARMTLTGHGNPERLQAAAVWADFFPVLGTAPVFGRTFVTEENDPGRGDVAVLSFGLWQRLFGSDRAAVGQSIVLDGVPHEVIGVMPESVAYPAGAQLWVPLVFDFDVAGSRGAHYLRVLGRLRAGTTRAVAGSEMSALASSLAQEYPDTNRGWGARVENFKDLMLGDRVTTTVLVLWAAVGLVLLIACVNLTNLFAARAAGQRVEFAVRTALGASRRRLVRQLFTESLAIATLGLLFGLVLGEFAVRALIRLDPANLPRLHEVKIDGFVLAVSAAMTLGVSFVVGLVPAMLGRRGGLFTAVRDVAAYGGPAGSQRVRRLLVMLQVAVAVVVVVGSGVVLKSLWRLQLVDPGFEVDRVAVFNVAPPADRYPDYPQLRELHRRLLADFESLPSVTAAGVTNVLPLHGALRFSFRPVTLDVPSSEQPSGLMRTVTPGYFTAMGIPLLEGRLFDESDRGDRPVVIINESLSRAYFADNDPVGQQLDVGYSDAGCPCEVVGVVGAVRQADLTAETMPGYYLPYAQTGWRTVSVVVRTTGDPEDLLVPIRETVGRHDRDLAIDNLGTFRSRVAATISAPRFNAILLGAFGALSLVLALVGVYGVTAFSVNARVPEIGVRLALGATGGRVAARVVGQGLVVTLVGVLVGSVAAFGVTRFLAVMLYEVEPFDLVTVATVVVLLFVCGLVSSYLPARKAANVDPVVALRAGD